MGLRLLLVAGGLTVAGYLAYRKLQEWEADIREEIESGRSGSAPVKEKVSKPPPLRSVSAPAKEEKKAPPVVTPSTPVDKKKPSEVEDLSGQLLAWIGTREGELQTALYAAFPGENRRMLQGILLELDREGKIRREKEKGTYRLFPR